MLCFVASILFYLLQNFSNKQFSKTVKRSSTGITLVQNGICVLCSALALLIVSGVKIMPAPIIAIAALFGCFYLLTVFLLLKAFHLGSMGNSTLICNIGMFIASFYGIFRFRDAFTVYIGIGTALLFIAILLCTPIEKKVSFKWFWTALASGISNGIVASIKREAVALYADDIQIFLIWGFFFAALFAFLFLSFTKANRDDAAIVLKRPKLILFGVFAGIGTSGANLFQMLAVKTVSSAIVYPLTSGILVVSLWLVSYFFYKEEQLKAKNILAVLLCVAAIILVNIK